MVCLGARDGSGLLKISKSVKSFVANVVGIKVSVVSGLPNPNDCSVLALKRRPRWWNAPCEVSRIEG